MRKILLALIIYVFSQNTYASQFENNNDALYNIAKEKTADVEKECIRIAEKENTAETYTGANEISYDVNRCFVNNINMLIDEIYKDTSENKQAKEEITQILQGSYGYYGAVLPGNKFCNPRCGGNSLISYVEKSGDILKYIYTQTYFLKLKQRANPLP